MSDTVRESASDKTSATELNQLGKTSSSHHSAHSIASHNVQDQIVSAGCLAQCHFGHQILPVLAQSRDTNSTRREMQSRPERLRATKSNAAAKMELAGPAPRYLHTHLEFIYYACMIPYKREMILEDRGMLPISRGCKLGLYYLQKVSKTLQL